MKLAVEEPESEALRGALEGQGPYLTSVVGEIEMIRVCRRGNVPAEQIEELRDGLVVVALDGQVQELAAEARPPTLRTLDAIQLATALSLRPELQVLVTYDLRLTEAAENAGLTVMMPA